MEFDLQNVDAFLAPYITRERRPGFLASLKDFPTLHAMFTGLNDPEPLQGDCWAGVPVYNFETGERKPVKAVLLSNSCDVTAENERATPVNLCFAALISLTKYQESLLAAGFPADRVDNHLADVRAQKVSSLFYFPPSQFDDRELIAVMDLIHTVPASYFANRTDFHRIFSLSDVGFWLFVFKLSFHFCRLHEKVNRTPNDAELA